MRYDRTLARRTLLRRAAVTAAALCAASWPVQAASKTVAVQKTMGSMINLDGATLLFPTSFGYFDPHVLKSAT